ncbi:Trafficking protein particle complex subunit 4, partial [Armadillidium nasatum]
QVIMTVYSIYILSKSGGLIYQLDNNAPLIEHEKTFSYPLELKLELINRNITVVFGQRDGIKVGHVLTNLNGISVTGAQMEDGRNVFEVLKDTNNYPISLKFSRLKLSTNEKIFQASMFYPLYALACQLSPEPKSSGIQVVEMDNFRLQCLQTLTGVKFIVICDPKQNSVDSFLKKLYEIYADFALKNPFYSLEMPIRCDLFNENLKVAIEQLEKSTLNSV